METLGEVVVSDNPESDLGEFSIKIGAEVLASDVLVTYFDDMLSNVSSILE